MMTRASIMIPPPITVGAVMAAIAPKPNTVPCSQRRVDG